MHKNEGSEKKFGPSPPCRDRKPQTILVDTKVIENGEKIQQEIYNIIVHLQRCGRGGALWQIGARFGRHNCSSSNESASGYGALSSSIRKFQFRKIQEISTRKVSKKKSHMRLELHIYVRSIDLKPLETMCVSDCR